MALRPITRNTARPIGVSPFSASPGSSGISCPGKGRSADQWWFLVQTPECGKTPAEAMSQGAVKIRWVTGAQRTVGARVRDAGGNPCPGPSVWAAGESRGRPLGVRAVRRRPLL
ncbi:hypothetical protein GCM10010217_43130 [Streptomyces tubercidicus]